MLELNKIYKIYLGDCLDLMKQIPDKSIDLVLTDPPYGVNLEYNSYSDTLENWKSLMLNAIPEIKRISKIAIMPCCQIQQLKFWYDNFPPDWIISWYKGSSGQIAKCGFNDWEPLLYYGEKWIKQAHDYIKLQSNTNEIDFHPCPKPVKWYEKIIEKFTNENNLIFDSFAGSGTLAIACHNLNRNFICIEKDPEYHRKSVERYEKHKLQYKLAI